jgi:hypothetical protein
MQHKKFKILANNSRKRTNNNKRKKEKILNPFLNKIKNNLMIQIKLLSLNPH